VEVPALTLQRTAGYQRALANGHAYSVTAVASGGWVPRSSLERRVLGTEEDPNKVVVFTQRPAEPGEPHHRPQSIAVRPASAMETTAHAHTARAEPVSHQRRASSPPRPPPPREPLLHSSPPVPSPGSIFHPGHRGHGAHTEARARAHEVWVRNIAPPASSLGIASRAAVAASAPPLPEPAAAPAAEQPDGAAAAEGPADAPAQPDSADGAAAPAAAEDGGAAAAVGEAAAAVAAEEGPASSSASTRVIFAAAAKAALGKKQLQERLAAARRCAEAADQTEAHTRDRLFRAAKPKVPPMKPPRSRLQESREARGREMLVAGLMTMPP